MIRFSDPGEEGGTAVAETLSGRNNPAGRLPVKFYKDVSQLPPFEDYSMKGCTYRYVEGTPLYPFGYGLSYTTFAYSELQVPDEPVAADSPVHAEVMVKNTGKASAMKWCSCISSSLTWRVGLSAHCVGSGACIWTPTTRRKCSSNFSRASSAW